MTQAAVGPDAKGVVLGGTGKFAGVRGQTDVLQRSNGHQFDANFRIELIRRTESYRVPQNRSE